MKLVILLIFLVQVAIWAQEKLNIAVLDLEPDAITESEAKTLSKKLRVELFNIGKYTIMEREKMVEILNEQGFQQAGCTSQECAVEIGQLIGVQYMISGSVGKIENTYLITLRIINVEKGNIEKSIDEEVTGSLVDVLKVGIHNAARKISDLEADRKVTQKPRQTAAATDQKTSQAADVHMGKTMLLLNVLGFLQFGPIFQGDLRIVEDLYINVHSRVSMLGLAYRALVEDEVTGGAALGAGITKFIKRPGKTSRLYAGVAFEYGWGSNRGDVDYIEEWEGTHTYFDIYGNAGYRWRFPSGLFVNCGGIFGFVIPVTDIWHYTAGYDDGSDHEGKSLSLLIAMLELSLGWEF